MSIITDLVENLLIDGLFRGGALAPAGTVNSTAVVKGVWTASTAYALGDVVVPHANMTAAGGKFLRCTTAGTSGTNNALAVPAVLSTLTDNTVTWTAISGMPSYLNLYFGLFTVAPTDVQGTGTEVSGGSYSRQLVACTLANFAGTQATASTTASTGTSGTTSNNNAITFSAPTANWGTPVAWGLFDQLTGGNLIAYGAIIGGVSVLSGASAVSCTAGGLSITIDN